MHLYFSALNHLTVHFLSCPIRISTIRERHKTESLHAGGETIACINTTYAETCIIINISSIENDNCQVPKFWTKLSALKF